jgi:hypothetical protein
MAGARSSQTKDATMRRVESKGGDGGFSLSRPSSLGRCLAKRTNDHHLASLSETLFPNIVAEDSPLIMRSRIT